MREAETKHQLLRGNLASKQGKATMTLSTVVGTQKEQSTAARRTVRNKRLITTMGLDKSKPGTR